MVRLARARARTDLSDIMRGDMKSALTSRRNRPGAPAGRWLFTDKLGERLAFERAAVRLYDGLIAKLEDQGAWPGGPDHADLERIRDQERRHHLMVQQAMEELGSDAGFVTRSADLHLMASMGLPRVLADPRTTLRQGLEAILTAELEDNESWETLIDLARAVGEEERATDFEAALKDEREHLRRVRGWLAAGLTAELAEPRTPPQRDTKKERTKPRTTRHARKGARHR